MRRLIIGLMSGTSADGVDAAVVSVNGCGTATDARLVGGAFTPYDGAMRAALLDMASGDSCDARAFCLMNRLLGERFADACEAACAKTGVRKADISLVGSHGHTFWHAPSPEDFLGARVAATLQLGDPSPIAERIGCAVASDFRVRDVAAGGQGAPLVPYTDFLLYRDAARDIALQNIGGIANVTFLPAGCAAEDVTGFDTGPGNMVMDALARRVSPELRYDPDGMYAARGRVDTTLLARLMDDPYYALRPPKSTGREKYGPAFARIFPEDSLSPGDALATATMLTAETIARSYERFSPFGLPARMIAGGGGVKNKTLMRFLRARMPGVEILTNADVGWDDDLKEAVAFAILANECVNGRPNNAPGATGAAHKVVMGRITPS